MSDKEKIREVIEKRYEYWKEKEFNSHSIESEVRMSECQHLLLMVDSLPEEPASDDFEEDSSFEKILQEIYIKYDKKISIESLLDIASHFVEWQKEQDEKLFKDDSWNYIEENYPNISQEEKLRLYDISIKSRLAGANAIKQKMKEALQTEYEKGRFDMRMEMMKTLIGGEIVKDIHNQLKVTSEPLNDTFGKFGDKVKIIICKTEQQ